MGNRPPRTISERERRQFFSTLDTHSRADSISAIRTRALAQLTADTGLRLSELLSLDCAQIIEDVSAKSPRIVSQLELTKKQAKGRKTTDVRAGYSSERTIFIPRRSRAALLAYLRAVRKRGWLLEWKGSPWITIKGRGRKAHVAIGKRAVQDAFRQWQIRARIRDPFRWHDLRHTAITRWARASGADVYAVAELSGHRDIRTTQRYVHQEPARLTALSEAASVL